MYPEDPFRHVPPLWQNEGGHPPWVVAMDVVVNSSFWDPNCPYSLGWFVWGAITPISEIKMSVN